MGISWAEMEGDDNRFSSGIPKDNKRLERSDNKPHSEEQAAMETRKRRRDAAEHFAKNFSILDALRSNLPEVFAAEILPKVDLLSTLSLAQVNKKYRDEVWSVNGVSSLEPKIKARAHMLVERVKKNGMDNETNYWNTKPMYWAVKHGNVPAVRALLASEEDVDRSLFKEYIPRFYVWDDFGPLHLAVDEGWLPVVKALIQAGANVDNLYAADDEDEHYYENSYYPHIRSETPLCLAAGNGRVDICLELIKAGADVRLNTPLRDAAAVGNLDCVQALIDAGADVNCFRLWRAPLETAAAHGHVEIVKALIQAGADVNMRDGAGRTPLFHAAGTGNDPICLMELLKAGADMNIASYPSEFEPGFEDMHTGITPLHVAACEGNESCVMLLVQAGADVRKTDRTDDRTPLSDAERGAAENDGEMKTRYKNIVQALKYAGA